MILKESFSLVKIQVTVSQYFNISKLLKINKYFIREFLICLGSKGFIYTVSLVFSLDFNVHLNICTGDMWLLYSSTVEVLQTGSCTFWYFSLTSIDYWETPFLHSSAFLTHNYTPSHTNCLTSLRGHGRKSGKGMWRTVIWTENIPITPHLIRITLGHLNNS